MMPDDDYPHPLGLHVTENRERDAKASFAAPTLLACPFCGGKAKARQPYAPKDIWEIGCDALGCDVNPEVSGIYERCIKAWNRRRLVSLERMWEQRIITLEGERLKCDGDAAMRAAVAMEISAISRCLSELKDQANVGAETPPTSDVRPPKTL